MDFYILIGQRKCSYDGQYAAESLEVADESTMEENPGWIYERKEYYNKSGDFEALEIIVVTVQSAAIYEILNPIQHVHKVPVKNLKKLDESEA